MAKVNRKLVDVWSAPHLLAGYLFGRYTDLNVLQFSAINIGFELFEAWLKKRYDIFNIPFGRGTVYESRWNSVADILITTGGFLTGQLVKTETFRPMIDYLQQNYQQSLTGIEIGVYHGVNSLRMFQNLPIKHLYLVDPYLPYEENILFLPKSFDTALKKLEPYHDRITPLQMKSEEAIYYIPEYLDFVYIDGNHSYEHVKRDISLYYPKIRLGGVIGGHDIANNPLSKDIKRAVEEFCIKNNLKYYVKIPDWWIVKPEI